MGQFLCTFWNSRYFLLNFFVLSTYSLLAVTFERFFAIVYPYHYQRIFGSKKAVVLILSGVWGIVLTFRIYPFFQWYVDDSRICKTSPSGSGLGVVIFLLQYAIPLTSMTYMYSRIALELSKSVRRVIPTVSATEAQQRSNDQGESLLRARRNIFKALLIVFVTFVICWSMNQFLFFLHNMAWRTLDFTSPIYVVSVAMISLNVFVNPFIYSFKYKRFQQACRRLLYRATGQSDRLNATDDITNT